MKNEGIIEGQISIFELHSIEFIKPNGKIIKEAPIIKSDNLDEIFNTEFAIKIKKAGGLY